MSYTGVGVGLVGLRPTFGSRILISRGFEAVNTVFEADFVFGAKNSSSPTT